MADYSIPALTAAAGVDPWALAAQVLDTHPDTVRHLGQVFTARGADATEVARVGGLADTTTATAFTVDAAPVFDAPASAATGRELLSDDGAAITATGAVFSRLADDLVTARGAAQRALDTITDTVNQVIADRNTFAAAHPQLLPEDAEAVERAFHARAVQAVTDGATPVQRVLDDYDTQATAPLRGDPRRRPQPRPGAAPAS